jgi:hypothetical protein
MEDGFYEMFHEAFEAAKKPYLTDAEAYRQRHLIEATRR